MPVLLLLNPLTTPHFILSRMDFAWAIRHLLAPRQLTKFVFLSGVIPQETHHSTYQCTLRMRTTTYRTQMIPQAIPIRTRTTAMRLHVLDSSGARLLR